MIRSVECCFVGCRERVDWGDDDSVVAAWLLFHATYGDRIVSIWLCPRHAVRYGWKDVDLRRAKGGEPLPEEIGIIASTLEALRGEDPEAFDPQKMIPDTLEAMRVRGWSISSTLIAIYDG